MILLLLGMLQEHLVPSPKKLDRLDRVLLGIIQMSLLVLFLTLPHVVATTAAASEGGERTVVAGNAPDDFFLACSGGKLSDVQAYLSEHPDWINARTANGEACLHLTGIYGYPDVTEYMLLKGANPNIRSTYEHGLRMHPLSWNVYGGHVANVHLLLQYGADVNLDFDSMMATSTSAITAMDVVLELVQNEPGDDRFVQLEQLLREHGGKTMKELTTNNPSGNVHDDSSEL